MKFLGPEFLRNLNPDISNLKKSKSGHPEFKDI